MGFQVAPLEVKAQPDQWEPVEGKPAPPAGKLHLQVPRGSITPESRGWVQVAGWVPPYEYPVQYVWANVRSGALNAEASRIVDHIRQSWAASAWAEGQ